MCTPDHGIQIASHWRRNPLHRRFKGYTFRAQRGKLDLWQMEDVANSSYITTTITNDMVSLEMKIIKTHTLPMVRKVNSARFSKSVEVAAAPVSSSQVLKVEAKKGEWLPGLASLASLNRRLAGDNEFDPLGLAEDPAALNWYVQAELQNVRWAMLGVAGMLIPKVLTKTGLINAPLWYDAGEVEYFAPASTLFVIEFILFHYVEIRRWQDIKYPGSVSQDPFFKSYKLPPALAVLWLLKLNLLNFPANEEYKEKEIANGRLAMLAFLELIVQSRLTGSGPFENLLNHLADPLHTTIVQPLSK